MCEVSEIAQGKFFCQGEAAYSCYPLQMLVDTRQNQSDQNLASLAYELSTGFEGYDPLEGILENLDSSLIPPAPFSMDGHASVSSFRQALDQLSLILLSLDEAPESEAMRTYTESVYGAVLNKWADITRWMFYLILSAPKLDPGGPGAFPDVAQALRIVSAHTHRSAYKEEIVALPSSVDVLFLLLCQADQASGEFWDVEPGPNERQSLVANLLLNYCSSEAGRGAFIARLASATRGSRDAISRALVGRVLQLADSAGVATASWDASTVTCIIEVVTRLAVDPRVYHILRRRNFLEVYAASVRQLHQKGLNVPVPNDRGFCHRLSGAIGRVIKMAIMHAPSSPAAVAKVLEAGMWTCSFRCLPPTSSSAGPNPIVEVLRAVLPYLYTSRAVAAISKDIGWENARNDALPLSGASAEIWSACMRAVVTARVAYGTRADGLLVMCSNFKVRRSSLHHSPRP